MAMVRPARAPSEHAAVRLLIVADMLRASAHAYSVAQGAMNAGDARDDLGLPGRLDRAGVLKRAHHAAMREQLNGLGDPRREFAAALHRLQIAVGKPVLAQWLGRADWRWPRRPEWPG